MAMNSLADVAKFAARLPEDLQRQVFGWLGKHPGQGRSAGRHERRIFHHRPDQRIAKGGRLGLCERSEAREGVLRLVRRDARDYLLFGPMLARNLGS